MKSFVSSEHHNQYPHSENAIKGLWHPLGDEYVVGYDPATEGGDYSVAVVLRRPGKIRKFLRRCGIDRSNWEAKIVDTQVFP